MQTPEQDPNSYAAQIKGKSGLRRIINACGYTRDGFKAACEEQGFRQLLWLNIPLIILAFILPFGLATRMIFDCVILSVAHRRTLQYRRGSRRGPHIAGKTPAGQAGERCLLRRAGLGFAIACPAVAACPVERIRY